MIHQASVTTLLAALLAVLAVVPPAGATRCYVGSASYPADAPKPTTTQVTYGPETNDRGCYRLINRFTNGTWKDTFGYNNDLASSTGVCMRPVNISVHDCSTCSGINYCNWGGVPVGGQPPATPPPPSPGGDRPTPRPSLALLLALALLVVAAAAGGQAN